MSKGSDFSHVVEVTGKWPTTASCIIFFLLPETVDSDRPTALLATQIRWWDWREEVMEDWKHPVEWNAPTREAGGAEYTVW